MGAGMTLAKRRLMLNEPHLLTAQSDGILTLGTDMRAPLKALRVGFEPVQDLHGYDAPWPAGGGKNIAPYSIADSFFVGYKSLMWENGYTSNRVTSTGTGFSFSRINNNYGCGIVLGKLKEGQAYTIKATRSNLGWTCNIVKIDADAVLSSETGVSRTVVHSSVNIENGYTFTALGGNIKYALNFYSAAQDQSTFDVSNIQLEIGSAATNWTPYSNICPITGWDGANVEARGKNLLDMLRPSYGKTSNATAYKPYSGSTTPISWADEAGTVYGGYLTWLWDGTVRLTKTMASVDMGDLTWAYISKSTVFTTTKSDMPLKTVLICTCYSPNRTVSRVENIADKEIWNMRYAYNPHNICVKDVTYTDAASFKTSVTGQKIVYTLATPITYTLTPTEALRTLRGENNIWSDANGAISATYWTH